MKASYLVANRLPAFSVVRHLSTREGDKEANRAFFRDCFSEEVTYKARRYA
jgi:hypothetical protein